MDTLPTLSVVGALQRVLLLRYSALIQGLGNGRGASSRVVNPIQTMRICGVDASMNLMPLLCLRSSPGCCVFPVGSYLTIASFGSELPLMVWSWMIGKTYLLSVNAQEHYIARYHPHTLLRYKLRCNVCKHRMATLQAGQKTDFGGRKWSGMMIGGHPLRSLSLRHFMPTM